MKYTFPYENKANTELKSIDGIVEEAFIGLDSGMAWDGSDAVPAFHIALVGDSTQYRLNSRLLPRVDKGERVRLYVDAKNTDAIQALHILDKAGETLFRYIAMWKGYKTE